MEESSQEQVKRGKNIICSKFLHIYKCISLLHVYFLSAIFDIQSIIFIQMRLMKLADVVQIFADVLQMYKLADVLILLMQLADVMISWVAFCLTDADDKARYQPIFYHPVTKPSKPYRLLIFIYHLLFDVYVNLFFILIFCKEKS